MKFYFIFWLLLSLTQYSLATPESTLFEILKEEAMFPGLIYRPHLNNSQPRPAIIFLHGSEGGNGNFWIPSNYPPLPTGEDTFTNQLARHYASLGYVTYSLCYFDCGHLTGNFAKLPPDELVNVDIKDYVFAAIKWLRTTPFVQGQKVVLWGGSRGAELTLLTSSLTYNDPDTPDAIIAESPSDFMASAFTKKSADALSKGQQPDLSDSHLSAWIFGGQYLAPPYSSILTEMYTNPSLITFWETDPIWGPMVDIKRIMSRYKQKNINYIHHEYKEDADIRNDFINFQQSLELSTQLFIELKGTGHGAPMTLDSRDLFFATVNAFLEKWAPLKSPSCGEMLNP